MPCLRKGELGILGGGGVILGEKCEEETREVRGKRERVASNEKEL